MADPIGDAVREGLRQAREDATHRERMRVVDWLRGLADVAGPGQIRILVNSLAGDIEKGEHVPLDVQREDKFERLREQEREDEAPKGEQR